MTEENPNASQPQGQEQPPKSNTEMKFTQDDVNRIVQERLKAEKTKFEQQIEEQKAEAQRQAELAKMDELQRAQAELEDFKNKYQAEADKNALSIQKDETRKFMKEKGLPDCFLDSVLVPKDTEATKKRIDTFKGVFDEAVKQAVEAKIPSHVPQGKSGSGNIGDLALRSAMGLK